MGLADIYYPLTLLSTAMLMLCSIKVIHDRLSFLIAALISGLYLIAMFRSHGPDVANYRDAYYLYDIKIMDPGFDALMWIARLFGLNFEFFMLSVGLLNLLLLLKICRHFRVKYGIVVAILILHLFVTRDFAQFRVALAINFILFGFTCAPRFNILFYILGVSTHLTTIILVGAIWGFNFYNNFKNYTLMKHLPYILVFCLGISISNLGFIDPRIDLYVNWQQQNYGNPVNSYNQLAFILFLLLISFLYTRTEMNLYSWSFIYAGIIFVSFSNVSIFSYRLANVALSLYPFFIASKLNSSSHFYKKIFLLSSFIFIINLREKTDDVINAIKIGITQ